ncbi:MAG: OmpH family outer membrane protein [Mariprofundaceae bacterium]
MKRWLLLLGMMSAVFVAQPAFAADLKIAYVDIKRAVENTKTYQDGMKMLEELTGNREKELRGLEEKILEASSQLRSQSMLMSPEQLAMKQEDQASMRKKFERMQQDAQEELMREKRRLDQGVFADFYRVVGEYAKAHDFDLILQKQSALIFGSEALDISAEISKELDKE